MEKIKKNRVPYGARFPLGWVTTNGISVSLFILYWVLYRDFEIATPTARNDKKGGAVIARSKATRQSRYSLAQTKSKVKLRVVSSSDFPIFDNGSHIVHILCHLWRRGAGFFLQSLHHILRTYELRGLCGKFFELCYLYILRL